MTSKEVEGLVQQQIGGRQTLPCLHSIDLSRCLVKPVEIPVIFRRVRDGELEDQTENVWLVLEEKPGKREGYKIVYSEEMKKFGLVSAGFPKDPYPVLCGYYGSFPTTLEAM